MDDLLLFTPTKKAHMAKFIKSFIKEWAQNISKKCQLFKAELQYMGNVIFIKDKKVCVKPLRNRIEAILKLEPPKMPKGCRSFAGRVNFLSMFLPRITEIT